AIHQAYGVTRIALRVGKNVSAVIIKLHRPEGEVRVEVNVRAAAKRPGCARVTGRGVRAEMGQANQSVDEEMKLSGTGSELRAKENVIFARADAAAGFVIAAKIHLEAKPIVHVSCERRLPAAAVGQRVAIQQ